MNDLFTVLIYVGIYFSHNFSDNDVDLSEVMSIYLSDNFVVVCMALTGQELVFKINVLTNEHVTS